MAAELVGAVLKLRRIDPTQKLILLSLAYHCNTKTLRCDPSVQLIADEVGISRRLVFYALDNLTTAGLLIRHSGKGRGHRNQYSFPPAAVSQDQGSLWGEKGAAYCTDNAKEKVQSRAHTKGKEKVQSQAYKRCTPLHTGVQPRAHTKGKERERKGNIPYGRLSAAGAYQQALADLPQNGNRQRQIAVLIDFTRAHCPVAAVPGRLAALVRDYPAEEVLKVIWQAIPKDRPLDYAQATLKHTAERVNHQRSPPTETDFSEYERVSRQGKPHTEEEDDAETR